MKQKKYWLPRALLALAVATVFLILPGRSGGEAARASRPAAETPKAADVEPRHEETKLGELSDGETFWASEFSDDGCHIACLIKKGEKQLVALDGKLGPEFDEVEYLSISPDGTRVAYWAKRAGKGYVVIDHRIGPQYDTLESISYPTKIAFSSDGKRMAYLVAKGEKKFLVIDGKPEPEFDEVSAFTFSPDGKRFGYKVRTGDEYRFVVDGKLGPKAATYGGLTFSPDGRRLACGITWGHGEQYYIVDGVKEQGYDRTENFVFSPDGKHYAYAARPDKDADYVVVVDGKPKWPGYDAVDDVTFSPDGRRLAYVASKGADEQFMVLNGEVGPSFDEVCKYSRPTFSPDSKHLAYVADQTTLVLDGEQQQPGYRMIWGLTFSPDSAHLAYKAANGGEFVVVDGKPGQKYEKLSFEPLAFRADGVIEYLAFKGGSYYRVKQTSPAWVSAQASQTKPVAATEEAPSETRKTTGRRSLFEDEEPTPATEATTPKRTQPARTREGTGRSGLFEDEEPPATETAPARRRASTTAAPARRSALFEDEEPAPATQPSTRRQPSTGARTRATGLFEDEERGPATRTKAEKETREARAPRREISLDLGNKVFMKLVLVSAGKFMMGSATLDFPSDEDEFPQREVTISKSFYMGIYEVTQEQYQAVMGENPSAYEGPKNPVNNVSWNNATDFCAKLFQKTGMKARLPTEAEWEYACRAGTTTDYWFGDYDLYDLKLGDYDWYSKNSGERAHPVGQKRPNPWGLYDMHGNVSEWCADWYDKECYDTLKDETVDPKGPESGQERVYRGGNLAILDQFGRSANRESVPPDSTYNFLGFRIVVEPAKKERPASTGATPPRTDSRMEGGSPQPSRTGRIEQDVATLTVKATATETQPAEKTTPAESAAPAKEISLDLGGNVSTKLALIPAGKFMMGAPASEQGAGHDEKPQHGVVISKPFYMSVYEVTQEQYQAVTGKNPSPREFKAAKNPVVMLTWKDVQEFCKRLSAKTGKTVRLPTEAEWEYACRAGTTTPFNTGATIGTGQANYDGNSVYGSGRKGTFRQKLTPVGSFKPNARGLYDMHGNAWEWCSDWYGGQYYANAKAADPQGPSSGKARLVRGGSYKDGPSDCRSAARAWFGTSPQSKNAGVGFRVLVEAEKVVR
jgi:formylglycine-generating enzyme required for sulfatase activity/WD40 repeat protein